MSSMRRCNLLAYGGWGKPGVDGGPRFLRSRSYFATSGGARVREDIRQRVFIRDVIREATPA
jgi:hypothetical protein